MEHNHNAKRYFTKSEEELREETYNLLEEEGFSTHKGSINRLFANIIIRLLTLAYSLLEKVHLNHFISTADLDSLRKKAVEKGIKVTEENTSDELKYKIVKHNLNVSSCNKFSIREFILENFRNVDDVRFIDFIQGSGSSLIYIQSFNQDKNELEIIKNDIQNKLPSGVYYEISYTKNVELTFNLKVNTTEKSTSKLIDLKNLILRKISDAIYDIPETGLSKVELLNIINSVDESISSSFILEFSVEDEIIEFTKLNSRMDSTYILSEDSTIKFD